MYDAAGVRRAAGRQAAVLNRLVDDLMHQRPIVEERLRELLGHTPVEVLAGAALGIAIGLIRF
jgi:acid phosphatase family membrane protein YuiD